MPWLVSVASSKILIDNISITVEVLVPLLFWFEGLGTSPNRTASLLQPNFRRQTTYQYQETTEENSKNLENLKMEILVVTRHKKN